MVNEFDKEIDAMLRDLAKGDTFAQVLPDLHLDADEISAFAENALPQKARLRTMEHLSDCSKCRKILANTVLFNSETESEIIHEESKIVATIPVTPWYQRLFAFPALSYAMGGLAVLLFGMIGLMVFQNSNNSEPMVAQSEKTYNKPDNTGGASSEGDAPVNESYTSNSSVPTAIATPSVSANAPAANSASKDVTPISPAESNNSNASSLKTEEEVKLTGKITDEETTVATKSAPPTDLDRKEEPKPVATPVNKGGEDYGNVERRDKNEVAQKSVNEIPIQNRSNQIMSPDGQQTNRNYPSPPTSVTGVSREQEKGRSEPMKPKKKVGEKSDDAIKDSSSETRSVGGKSFRNKSGVWTDTSYSGGSTKNVKRGSDDYKKLDAALQNIGNSLSGTVIVVWGGKNYKIQ